MSNVFPLRCETKNYAWGKRGWSSAVAQLLTASASSETVQIDDDTTYAELWMGTHPSAPSKIMSTQDERRIAERPLTDELRAHPEFLGEKVQQKFGGIGLPFLFKVLSVRNPLSIQAHPNKIRAEHLHRQRPDLYGDPNHKPEMAVALTKFRALCGFQPFLQIVSFARDVTELRALIGESNVKELVRTVYEPAADATMQRAALKRCFTAVMTASKDSIEKQLSRLVDKLKRTADDHLMDTPSRLIVEIHEDFPGDVGCFAVYFLNYLCMEPGQALYLGADEAHAYLSGDCIEIMACSDNVVRAGLTPKFIDVEELCEMLTYECSSPESKIFEGDDQPESFSTVFDPPVPDFTLAKIQVPGTEKRYTFRAKDSASIILVVRGKGKYDCQGGYGTRDFVTGSTLFVPAHEHLTVEIQDSHDLLAFQAYCQL